jgi:DNA-binding transcriptional regulator YiaG
MPNLAQSLKAEIIRVSRKEIKSSVTPVYSANVALKKAVAEFKKKVAAIEIENKKLVLSQKTILNKQPDISPERAEKVRITAKSIRAFQNKLGLSQVAFAKLIGLSSQDVLVMEHKEGRLRMRAKTLSNILAIRDIGKREAKARLKKIESND